MPIEVRGSALNGCKTVLFPIEIQVARLNLFRVGIVGILSVFVRLRETQRRETERQRKSRNEFQKPSPMKMGLLQTNFSGVKVETLSPRQRVPLPVPHRAPAVRSSRGSCDSGPSRCGGRSGGCRWFAWSPCTGQFAEKSTDLRVPRGRS